MTKGIRVVVLATIGLLATVLPSSAQAGGAQPVIGTVQDQMGAVLRVAIVPDFI